MVWDDEIRGFGLRVKPSGVRSYIVPQSSRVPGRLSSFGRVLGHTVPATTARYAHLTDDPVREAVAKGVAKPVGHMRIALISSSKPWGGLLWDLLQSHRTRALAVWPVWGGTVVEVRFPQDLGEGSREGASAFAKAA